MGSIQTRPINVSSGRPFKTYRGSSKNMKHLSIISSLFILSLHWTIVIFCSICKKRDAEGRMSDFRGLQIYRMSLENGHNKSSLCDWRLSKCPKKLFQMKRSFLTKLLLKREADRIQGEGVGFAFLGFTQLTTDSSSNRRHTAYILTYLLRQNVFFWSLFFHCECKYCFFFTETSSQLRSLSSLIVCR